MKIDGSTAWRSITQSISDRSLSDALAGLRHVELANECLIAIPAERDGHQSHVPPARDIHRACEYALQLPGTTFGLLGVLLEGPSATDTGFCHPEPPHDRSPSVLGLFFGQTFGTATLPTDATVASSRSHCEFVYRIAALLGFVKFTWHEPLLILK